MNTLFNQIKGGISMPEIMLGIVIVAVILLLVIFFRYVPIGLWIRARASGVPLTIITLIGMRLRHLPQAGGRHDHGHQGRP